MIRGEGIKGDRNQIIKGRRHPGPYNKKDRCLALFDERQESTVGFKN